MNISPWIRRWATLIPPGPLLDLACGSGRHAHYLVGLGYAVTAVDRDSEALAAISGARAVQADLEQGPWPFPGQQFAGIVITNYLHRPLFPVIQESLAPSGVLLYETFAVGQGAYGRPSNPDFLLRPEELLTAFPELSVVAFEQGLAPGPAVVQRLCAWRGPQGQAALTDSPFAPP